MRPVAFDTETGLIRPAQLAPPLVCVTWQRPGEQPQIAHHTTAEPMLRAWLEDPEALIIGHNVAYDLAVVAERYPSLRPAIFAAYDADRVTDTQIRQQLLDIAAGTYRGRVDAKGRRVEYKYDLQALAKRLAGFELAKDGWRLSYANFIDTPLDRWDEKAREVQAAARPRIAELQASLATLPAKDGRRKALEGELAGLVEMVSSDPSRCTSYPLDDARATLACYQAQERHGHYLADQYRQARAAFALHLQSAWGLRTDERGVTVLRTQTEAELEGIEDDLVNAGLVRPGGTRDTKVAKARMVNVCRRAGIVIPRTDAHFAEDDSVSKCKAADGTPLPAEHDDCFEHVGLDADACESCEDDLLAKYAALTTLKKVLSNDIVALEGGTAYPIHTRYGLAATGRSTSSKPNIQNQSKRAGIREAFVPRPGKLFAQADFPQLELYTFSQCCVTWFGRSKMAEALNGGLDPHLWVASVILGISYDEALANKKRPDVKNARDLGKVVNFGVPGGLGDESLVDYARKSYGVTLTRDEAKKLIKETSIEAWPEMADHFARARALCSNPSKRATVETLFTRRTRGAATYCATCNNGFQALGADCAKNSGWLIARAAYVDVASPLFNARPVAFVHDEFIAEVDDGPRAAEAAHELARLMVQGANAFLPDVPIPLSKLEPTLMRRWSKNAVQRFDTEGRLVPWE